MINGEAKQVHDVSLTAVLAGEQIPPEHWPALAVARNGAIVPKSSWAELRLQDGDRIDIVMPFAGG